MRSFQCAENVLYKYMNKRKPVFVTNVGLGVYEMDFGVTTVAYSK